MKERIINRDMKEDIRCILLRRSETCASDKTGTTVTFLPDKEIFEETVYDYDILKQTPS